MQDIKIEDRFHENTESTIQIKEGVLKQPDIVVNWQSPPAVTCEVNVSKKDAEFFPAMVDYFRACKLGNLTLGNYYEILDERKQILDVENDFWEDGNTRIEDVRYSMSTVKEVCISEGKKVLKFNEILIKDDKGKELWINDAYFDRRPKDLSFVNEVQDEIVDIRVKASEHIGKDFEENLCEGEYGLDYINTMSPMQQVLELCKDVLDEPCNYTAYHDDNKYLDGYDCLKAIDKEFYGKECESDKMFATLLHFIKNEIHEKIEFIENDLYVANAKTKMNKEMIGKVYNGLLALFNDTSAVKITGRLLVKKLQQVF